MAMEAGRVGLEEEVLKRDVEHRLAGSVGESEAGAGRLDDVRGTDGEGRVRPRARESIDAVIPAKPCADWTSVPVRSVAVGRAAVASGDETESVVGPLEGARSAGGFVVRAGPGTCSGSVVAIARGLTVRRGIESPRLLGTLTPGPASSNDAVEVCG